MSPTVLETWINETLSEAEHLDIPGMILNADKKSPCARYGVDRVNLIKEGIPTEEVTRIYRGLFVYSVGFYELLKKAMTHSERKFTLITAIWKVYSILLEYCC